MIIGTGTEKRTSVVVIITSIITHVGVNINGPKIIAAEK